MDLTTAQATLGTIVRDVFGVENPFTLEQFKNKFVSPSIVLPSEVTCTVSGEKTWIYDPQPGQRVVKQSVHEKKSQNEDPVRPTRPINSMDDVLKYWEEVNFMTGEKVVNSKDVAESDSIVSSSNVFHSSLVNSSKNVLLSYNIFNSNYMVASKGNNACNFGIAMFDSVYCSSGYEIRWSNKVAKSLFITDSMDLYECMFCYSLRSKKYCIANMQFEKEEYMKIKSMVVEWILRT